MPRVVKFLRNPKKPICRACKRWHARGEAHLGDPRDWNVALLNIEPHRELAGDISRLVEDIYELPMTLSFADRVAAAVYRRDSDARFEWLPAAGLASDVDRVLYVAPAGASAALRCGVALRLTRHGRTQLQAQCEISATSDPLVLVGLTGLWIELPSYPGDAEGAAEFLARGERAIHRLTDTGRGAGRKIPA